MIDSCQRQFSGSGGKPTCGFSSEKAFKQLDRSELLAGLCRGKETAIVRHQSHIHIVIYLYM